MDEPQDQREGQRKRVIRLRTHVDRDYISHAFNAEKGFEEDKRACKDLLVWQFVWLKVPTI